MKQINYDEIISQLKAELNSECAIANIYGIVLASNIKEFFKGKIIPHKILSLISNSKDIADELNLNKINSFALEAQEYNYLFTFSEKLILISLVFITSFRWKSKFVSIEFLRGQALVHQ